MEAKLESGRVIAQCPTDQCGGSLTTYEEVNSNAQTRLSRSHRYKEESYAYEVWKLLQCANCKSGGIVKFHNSDGNYRDGTLEYFYPFSSIKTPLPAQVPDDIKKEYREAELCASVGAHRGASVLLRSTLEKTLKLNGYKSSDMGLERKIALAAKEGLLTDTLAKKALDKAKVLGDDVLHQDYRIILADEVNDSLKYVARVIEEFYEEREEVEKILVVKGRLKNNADTVENEATSL